jgi:hypothetical protein
LHSKDSHYPQATVPFIIIEGKTESNIYKKKQNEFKMTSNKNHTSLSHASWSVLVFVATAWCCNWSSLNKSRVSSTCTRPTNPNETKIKTVTKSNSYMLIQYNQIENDLLKNIITCLYTLGESAHVMLIFLFCLQLENTFKNPTIKSYKSTKQLHNKTSLTSDFMADSRSKNHL